MVVLAEAKKCNGCQTCANVCLQNAIYMREDKEGFLRPTIDELKCLQCGCCKKSCPVYNIVARKSNKRAYAAQNNDESIREKSSSGGLFFALAEQVLKGNGVVFGARFDSALSIIHDYTESVDGLTAFLGSKYVQSDVGCSYRLVKAFLEKGRTVLFSGTPCQIGGLKGFLDRDYKNLLCQDIICHGVPSPMVWRKYKKYRELEAASVMRGMSFRAKHYGWRMYSMLFEFANGTEHVELQSEDWYMRSYLRDLTLRPSCYDCSFKTTDRQADITLADFWGIDNVRPDMDDDHGTSLVIIHTDKGQKFWDAIQGSIKSVQVDANQAIYFNSAMVKSATMNVRREAFMRNIAEEDFDVVARKYCEDSYIMKIISAVKRVIRKLQHK